MKSLRSLVALLFAASTTVAQYSGYASVYFKESPDMSAADYNLNLAVSSDGLEWVPLNQNNPVARPTQGSTGLRDPFVLRKQTGGFVVIATDLKGTDWAYQSQYIHVWDSTDLRSFTGYRLLKLHSLATHTWAPEAFWDASRSQYAIVYSAVSTTGYNTLMVSYTTDFVTATVGTIFFNPGYDDIDGTFVNYSGTWYMYYKSQTNSTLLGARSTTAAANSWTIFTSSISPGRGVEAPEIIKHNSANTWYMYGDTWSPNGRFFAWTTNNLAAGTWTALSDRVYTQPINSKHAGYTPITATELTNLRNQWGTPTWNRIKSYNYPDRYIRHVNNTGRIDSYPMDLWQDQQWTLVSGLSDSSAISFRSVNFPSMYLRHSNYTIVLAANDGTSSFNADATFKKVAGLADSSWTSFQPVNYPDRYLRHYAYALRIDQLSSSSNATEKGDATFKIVY